MTPEEYAEVQRLAREVFMALTRETTNSADGALSVNVRPSIEALMFVAAAMIESLPTTEGQRGLREAVDQATAYLKSFTREFRTVFEETGRHGLSGLGMRTMTADEIPSKAKH